ncbi:MAG: FAD-dependent oxidoreductase [Planctomycetia bacterium]|nr:FAD-dependent oxidoreductase [Planctomycetia bacterium]
MRIAVIGSGIAGLTAAHRLHAAHDVTVLEAAGRPGGHAQTVDIETPEGERLALDTAFMVYNDRTYPHFVRLLAELNVTSRPTSMSFSVSDPHSGIEYNGGSLGGLFAQPRNLFRLDFLKMLRDIARFNREGRTYSADSIGAVTLGDFLAARRYGRQFIDHYLLPMGAAIWSCPTGTFAEFSMEFVVAFFRNHGLLDLVDRPTWRVITGGSRTYVEAMVRGFRDRLRLNTPVVSVRRNALDVEVRTAHGSIASFDHIVFACHSDQALRILGSDATVTERELLSAFPYQRNSAVLHTDENLLPRARRARACWNVGLTGDPKAPAVTTYDLNLLQGIRSERTYCVTLNADRRIDPRCVLGTFEYHHPNFTVGSRAAQERHAELIDVNRTSFCGAYWRNGFHEDGVVSAERVVAALIRSHNSPARSTPRIPTMASTEFAP